MNASNTFHSDPAKISGTLEEIIYVFIQYTCMRIAFDGQVKICQFKFSSKLSLSFFIATFPNQSEAPAFLAFIHRARSPQKPPAKLTPSRRRIHLAKAAVFHQGGNLKCLRFDGIPNYFLVRWCDIAVIHSNLCVRFWDGKSPNTVAVGSVRFQTNSKRIRISDCYFSRK